MASVSTRASRPRRPHHRALAGFGIGAALTALVWMAAAGTGEAGRVQASPTRSAESAAGPLGATPQLRPAEQLQARLRENPDDWRGWAALGLAYVDEARVTGNPALYPKADGAFDRSLSLRPGDNVAALAGRAALANARHDFAGGLRFADAAAAGDRPNPQVSAIRGDALVELGRYDEAFTAYQRAVQLAPGLASYTRAAYALDLQGDVAGATRSLELAVGEAFTPQDLAFVNFSLGELAWNGGDLEGAQQHYTRAAGADPAAVGPKAGLARVAAAGGAMDDAIALWRDVVERAPLPEYVGELHNLYKTAGRPDEAQRQLDLLGAQRGGCSPPTA